MAIPTPEKKTAVIGVLALQGAFSEHLQHLQKASLQLESPFALTFIPVRTPAQLASCSALIIPGGESTTMALIAERSGLLEPLREFVKIQRRPTWGTCAGMILLAESANRTKKGGQELIGGLDVRVNRNHFGRQAESFSTPLRLRFLGKGEKEFLGVFIRAPVVEALLEGRNGGLGDEVEVRAPDVGGERGAVEVLAELRREKGDARVVAVRQGNVVGTSFHPELTGDCRMHLWWLEQVVEDLARRSSEQ